MKRGIFLSIFFLLLIITLNLISSGSVGISPAFYKEHFEPGLEKEYGFRVFNSNPEEGIGLYTKGDLSEYINFSEKFVLGTGIVTVKMKLPDNIEKPGTHRIIIGAIEAKNESDIKAGTIGGVAAIEAPIIIMVPYPGKYIESKYNIYDINEGEKAKFEFDIENLGTEAVAVSSELNIYEENKYGKRIMTKKMDEIDMKTKSSIKVSDFLDTEDLLPGTYYSDLTLSYGEKKLIINDTFRVGEFLVEIIDYDYQFEIGSINKFNILVENKWNTRVSPVFADVTITDSGKVISNFKTISVDADPWEIKNLTGYFDAKDLEPKRYLASIRIEYGDTFSYKLVAIYLKEPEVGYEKYKVIGILSLTAIVTLIAIYLAIRIKKLKNQIRNNGRKK